MSSTFQTTGPFSRPIPVVTTARPAARSAEAVWPGPIHRAALLRRKQQLISEADSAVGPASHSSEPGIKPSRRTRQLLAARQRGIIDITCTNSDTDDKSTTSHLDQPHPSLYLLNATSLKKSNAMLKLTTDVLQQNIEIIFITESWLSSKQLSADFNIPGYIMHRRDRIKRVGGGLCTFIRNNINIIDFQTPPTATTVKILWSHCIHNNNHYFLANCYYPPKPKHNVQEFVSQLTTVMEHVSKTFNEPHFIIAGDFNGLDTKFLSTNFGLQCISNAVTHGKRILDKIFVSWPSTYTVRVVNSVLKTKHKSVVA